MHNYKISSRAYTKMMFHAAKYPHCAVNGILLATKQQQNSSASGGGNDQSISIVDAIPLFHQCLYVTPMMEIALAQIEIMANDQGLSIAGYYVAPENFSDSSIERAPAAKIGEKITENYPNACFIVIQNKLLTLNMEYPAIKLWQHIDGQWKNNEFKLDQSQTTLQAVSSLLKRGAMKDFYDYDNYLDNTEHDWMNEFLNRDLQKLLSMY